MVSLFDISTQKPLWSHLSTGVPTLDAMLSLQNDAILDMQSVPANPAFSAILCSMIISHLQASPAHTVVILETLNAFPWQSLIENPQYDPGWVDSHRITAFSLTTFAKLYAFFMFPPLTQKAPGEVLILVTNFHEAVEFYRLQSAATHEEHMLKHQIDKNSLLIENLQKYTEEGVRGIELPKPPLVSRESPFTKVQSHVNGLISMISDYTFKNSSVVLLMGHLEPIYKQVSRRDLGVSSSAETSFRSSQMQMNHVPLNSQNPQTSQSARLSHRESSRLVLSPAPLGPSALDKPSLADAKISARLVFYNDWFHKSPFSQRLERLNAPCRFHVSVVKVFNLNGIKNINEPVYFQYTGSRASQKGNKTLQSLFLDLSESPQEQEENALMALIQNSISSTQVHARERDSDNSGFEVPKRKMRKITIPSSPPNVVNLVHDDRLFAISQGFEAGSVGSEEKEKGEDIAEGESSDEEDESDVNVSGDDENSREDESGDEGDRGSEQDEGNEFVEERLAETPTKRKSLEPSDYDRTIPKLFIVDEPSFIEGSDVESTGTLLEDMENSQPDWLTRHS